MARQPSDLIHISGQDHGLQLSQAPSFLAKILLDAGMGLCLLMLYAKDKAAGACNSHVANILRAEPAFPGVCLRGLRLGGRLCVSLKGSGSAGGHHHDVILVFLEVILLDKL